MNSRTEFAFARTPEIVRIVSVSRTRLALGDGLVELQAD